MLLVYIVPSRGRTKFAVIFRTSGKPQLQEGWVSGSIFSCRLVLLLQSPVPPFSPTVQKQKGKNPQTKIGFVQIFFPFFFFNPQAAAPGLMGFKVYKDVLVLNGSNLPLLSRIWL